jgi:CRP-like cAMP-binding protein
MAHSSAAYPRNQLLSGMIPADLDLLRPHLEPLEMKVSHSIEQPDRPVQHVYFIEEGIASVVALAGDKREVEVGLIGREGVTGIVVIMGNDRSPHKIYTQLHGYALRIDSAKFREALDRSETLHKLLLNFVQSFMVQTGATAIANARATVEQRLARWVLMAHDRMDGDEMALTHEFLSIMLGVRRPGVTIAMNALAKRSLLRASRGRVTVLNRKGLEKLAGGFYGGPEKELRRLMSQNSLNDKITPGLTRVQTSPGS